MEFQGHHVPGIALITVTLLLTASCSLHQPSIAKSVLLCGNLYQLL